MTDGDALYRAILARPEDDTPRLVYADWLDENGHVEEAEFIRLDCWLESSSPDHPEYIELCDRREDLRLWLQTHAPKKMGKKLTGGLNVRMGGSWWAQTYRGFPRFITIDRSEGRIGAKGIRKLAAALEKAFARVPTRWLVAGFSTLEDLAEFLRQPVVEALERLTLDANVPAGDEVVRIVADSPRLQNLRGVSLNVDFGEAGAVALGQSRYFQRMDWLRLGFSQLTPSSVAALGGGRWFRNLRQIDFHDNLAPEAFEGFCRLPAFLRLQTLSFESSSFPVSAWRTFARSQAFPHLRNLALHETDMSYGEMQALAGAATIPLASLDLSLCGIGDEGVKAMIEAPWAGSLQSLDLSYNSLGPASARRIGRCTAFAKLKSLDLENNSIGVDGLKAIAGSTHLRELRTLLLGQTSAGRKTAMAPACHEFLKTLDLPHLGRLSLDGWPLGAETVRLLTTEKFHRLTRLSLSDCKISDDAVPDLLSSRALQGLVELDLRDNHLETGVANLSDRRVLPLLSSCNLTGNPIPPDLRPKLARRKAVTFMD
jgi:uncharacterized protein (TIGR02996 family)